MNTDQPTTLAPPLLTVTPPNPTKWEREHRAFLRLLPDLLLTHRGQYVAIHDGQVMESGDDALTVALRALRRVGNVDIHVGRVTEELPPVCRSGILRELGSAR